MTAQNKTLSQQGAKRTISEQAKADYAFRKKNCLHKIWIALPDGQTKTHYATDCSATIGQMVMRHVHTVTLSPAKGLQDCRNKEKYLGKKQDGYRTCIIYRRTADGWQEVEKYVGGNLVEQSTEQPGPEQYFKVFIINGGTRTHPLQSASTMQMILPILMLLIIGILLLACILTAASYMIAALVTGIIQLFRFIRHKQ